MRESIAEPIVRVGIIGLGRSGWSIHVATLEAMPDRFRVVAVCDSDSGRRDEAETRLSCRSYSAFEDLIRDPEVDLVVVASPSHHHARHAIAAMRVGKDVLVEKPFATGLVEADEMILVARETGRLLSASQDQRYAPDFLRVREVIESGKLGRILTIRFAWHWFRRRWDWQTLREFGGGSLNNDGSHAIDQALLLLPAGDPEVWCRMERTPLSAGDAEDHVKVILQVPGGPLVDLEFSNACAFPQDRWLVLGTQGGLTGSLSQIRWRYFDPRLVPPRSITREPTPDRSYNREDLPWIEESSDLSHEGHRASNKRLYHDLHATLRRGSPLQITPESTRRQIAVLESCRERRRS